MLSGDVFLFRGRAAMVLFGETRQISLRTYQSHEEPDNRNLEVPRNARQVCRRNPDAAGLVGIQADQVVAEDTGHVLSGPAEHLAAKPQPRADQPIHRRLARLGNVIQRQRIIVLNHITCLDLYLRHPRTLLRSPFSRTAFLMREEGDERVKQLGDRL